MADFQGSAPSPRRGQAVPFDAPVFARCYDYCLGGKDNFAVDRKVVHTYLARFPEGLDLVLEGRRFLYRLVRYLVCDLGIDQFIDIGAGLPTVSNVHQVAQAHRPEARVAYVDNDPMVLTHGRALLATNDRTVMIDGDLTASEALLDDPGLREVIDQDRPVAVLSLATLDIVADDDAVHASLDALKRRLAPGSYLALSQFATEDRELMARVRQVSRSFGMELRWRGSDEIRGFFAGLEPVEPGIVDVSQWRPDPAQVSPGAVPEPLRPCLGASQRSERVLLCGGLARKP